MMFRFIIFILLLNASVTLADFAKVPAELNAYEASILISMLKGPNFFNPLKNLDSLKSRTDIVFKKLIELKLYPDTSSVAWTDLEWKKWQSSLSEREQEGYFSSLWTKSNESNDIFDSYDSFVFRNKSNSLLKTPTMFQSPLTIQIYILYTPRMYPCAMP